MTSPGTCCLRDGEDVHQRQHLAALQRFANRIVLARIARAVIVVGDARRKDEQRRA